MCPVQWPTQTASSALAFHFWSKRDEKPHFIIFWLKDPWDIAVPKKKKISSTHFLPSSPQKNPFTSQTTSKNTFFFYVNCSLGTWRCFWRIRLSVLLISKFPSGSQRALFSSSQINASQSCNGFGNLWNSTRHLQPSLPVSVLPSGCW